MKALPRRLVADLAFFDLGLKVSRRGRKRKFQCCEFDALGLQFRFISTEGSATWLGLCPSGACENHPESQAE